MKTEIPSPGKLLKLIKAFNEYAEGYNTIVNLSGRGDKDLDYIREHYGYGEKYLK